jgi:hypothetical protein
LILIAPTFCDVAIAWPAALDLLHPARDGRTSQAALERGGGRSAGPPFLTTGGAPRPPCWSVYSPNADAIMTDAKCAAIDDCGGRSGNQITDGARLLSMGASTEEQVRARKDQDAHDFPRWKSRG